LGASESVREEGSIMTSVGKILVFFNLIFSVGVAALIAIVFSTRANWKAEYEKARNTALVYEAALKETDFRHQSELRSRDENIAALSATRVRLESQVKAAQDAELAAKSDLTKSQNATKLAQDNLDAAEKEVKRLQGERDLLAQDKLEREKMVTELTKGINDERQKRVDADNRAKASNYNSEQLRDQLKELVRENANLRGQLNSLGPNGGPSRSVLQPVVPPPPKDVKGTVVQVVDNGLTQISIGSNQGLVKDNKLVVYRIDPRDPKASQYLGELVITRVAPSEAIGQFIPANPRIKLPQVGDEVAATLSGK
jgi:hypothetical protein